MTVTAPTSLADALAALADEPGSLVLAGGTDLMVQVNEGRGVPGPRRCSRSAGVPELARRPARGRRPRRRARRATYTELMARAGRRRSRRRWPRRPARSARRRSATRARSAATSAPRRRRATRCRCSSRSAPPWSWRAATGRARGARRRVPHRPEGDRARRRASSSSECAIPVRRGPQEYLKVGVRNAMVIAVRIGRDGRRPRHAARSASGSARSGRPRCGAPDACAWLDRRRLGRRLGSTTAVAASSATRVAAPPARSTTTAVAPRTGGTPSACSAATALRRCAA